MQVIKYNKNNHPYVDLGNGFEIRLEDEDIADQMYIEKAKNELREEANIQREAIKELKELIANDKDFDFPHTDDFYYILFLRPCKYYAKSAFEKMQKYYKFKIKHKKVCENLTLESVRMVFEDDLVKIYPVRDKNGCRVLFVHGGKKWKPSEISTNDLFRSIHLSMQAAMLEPMSQINGVCVILDTDGLSFSQIIHITPMFAAMLLEWLQECVPIRIKGIYFTNNSYIFNIVFKIFKPFINAKLKKRIHFIGKDWQTLAKLTGKKCLNKDFDGELDVDNVDGKLLADILDMHRERIEALNKGGYPDN